MPLAVLGHSYSSRGKDSRFREYKQKIVSEEHDIAYLIETDDWLNNNG
jgi:hypothetical protein